MDYTVILHKAEEGGYWAEVPTLPGCYSQGKTVEETLVNIKEAIESHIEALKEDKQEIPPERDFLISKVEIKAA